MHYTHLLRLLSKVIKPLTYFFPGGFDSTNPSSWYPIIPVIPPTCLPPPKVWAESCSVTSIINAIFLYYSELHSKCSSSDGLLRKQTWERRQKCITDAESRAAHRGGMRKFPAASFWFILAVQYAHWGRGGKERERGMPRPHFSPMLGLEQDKCSSF